MRITHCIAALAVLQHTVRDASPGGRLTIIVDTSIQTNTSSLFCIPIVPSGEHGLIFGNHGRGFVDTFEHEIKETFAAGRNQAGIAGDNAHYQTRVEVAA